MPKLFCLIQCQDSDPDLDRAATPFRAVLCCGRLNRNWGAYLVSGTGPQLAAVNALPHVYGIVVVTESGDERWVELDGTIAPAVRTRLNTWLTNRGHPNIPAGWTYRQVLNVVYKRMNARFELDAFDVAD
jgi:hypothetical protein